MDIQVMEKNPGKCPICQMQMTKVSFNKENMNKIKFSKAQMKLANSRPSWAAVSTGLPNTGIVSLAVNGPNLFAGTIGNGVFRSTY